MHPMRHWTPRYIASRLSVEFYRSSQGEGHPDFAIGAIQFLGGWLGAQDRVFEYGCGHSTAWFARRVGSIISVENYQPWYAVIRDEVAGCPNVQLELIDSRENRPPGAPVSWDYVNRIKACERESFDLILDDGWARPYVSSIALDYLKKGGVFAWDDWAHSYPVPSCRIPGRLLDPAAVHPLVAEFVEKVQDWRRVVFDDGVHATALFFKPV